MSSSVRFLARAFRVRGRSAESLLLPVIVVSAAGVCGAVLLGETARPQADLQIAAPAAVAPGRTMAVRTFLFVEQGGRPRLRPSSGSVRLVSTSGGLLATARFRSSSAAGMATHLPVPAQARGRFKIEAQAEGDPPAATVRSQVFVRSDPRPEGVPGRLLPPLQAYRAGPLRRSGSDATETLELRVAGGVCVPGRLCELLLLIGSAPQRVRLESPRGFDVIQGPPDQPVTGVIPLSIRVNRPEAAIELNVEAASGAVATRAVRLPILLGGVAFRLPQRVVAEGTRPRLKLEGAADRDRRVIVDGFRDGIWERTGSISKTEGAGDPLAPFDALDAGLWRLQLRTDPYAAEAATTRLIWVAEASLLGLATLPPLIHVLQDRFGEDPYAAEVAACEGDMELAVAFLLARPEHDVQPLPIPVSGRQQASQAWARRQRLTRWGGALALGLLGILVAAFVLRRGVSATRQAAAVMRSAQTETEHEVTSPSRISWSVVAGVVAVALAFLAATLLILVRDLL